MPRRGERIRLQDLSRLGDMQQRCKRPWGNDGRYYVGVNVHPEWDKSYDVFRQWSLEHGVRRGLTFQRADTSGDSRHVTAVGATPRSDLYHNRGTEWIEYNGETLPSPVWAKRIGITASALRGRLRDGWTVAHSLTTPRGKLRAGIEHKPRGRKPYPPQLREAIGARRKLQRAIERRIREEQDR